MELVGDYKLTKTIGTGSFGKVKRTEPALSSLVGEHLRTKERVAIKIVDTKENRVNEVKLKKQLETAQSFHHPHIIRIHQSIWIVNRVYVVMEYASGGDLFDILCQRGRVSPCFLL